METMETRAPEARPVRLLLIHAESGARGVVRELERAGLGAAIVRVDGEGAMRAALRRERFDVVVSDDDLPGFGALDALGLLRALEIDVPLIVVSGRGGEERVVRAMRAGAHDFLRRDALGRLGASVDRELGEARLRRATSAVARLDPDVDAVRAERDRALALFQRCPIPIALFEGPTHVCVLANAAFRRHTRSKDVVGRPIREGVPELGRDPAIVAAWDEVYRTGQPRETKELALVLTAEDGRPRERIFDSIVQPVRGGRGEVTGVMVAAVEVTEQVRARRRVEEAREAAENANRLKDEFLATLSHELRTPLHVVLSWVGLMKQGHMDEAHRVRALDTIERSARNQAQIVEDIVDLSRIVTGKLAIHPREVDLAPVVAAAVDSVRAAAEAKHIELRVDLGTEPVPVWGDADRLQQVAWNLLSNAIKFTAEGGHVLVRLARERARSILTVEDDGVGIDAAFLPYVFARFTQADSASTRKYGGLGIGLAIVRHVVEMHGGEVEARSRGRGRGAEFVISLPSRAPAARA